MSQALARKELEAWSLIHDYCLEIAHTPQKKTTKRDESKEIRTKKTQKAAKYPNFRRNEKLLFLDRLSRAHI